MRKLAVTAGMFVGASLSLMAQNVSVYTIKDVAGALPPDKVTTANALPLSIPDGVAADKNGNVYVTDTGGHKVWKIDSAGKVSIVVGTGVFGLPTFGRAAAGQPVGLPSSLAVDADGNLYVGDRSQGRIYKIDSAGVITLFAGATSNLRYTGDGRLATQAELGAASADPARGPRGMVFGPDGNFYFADTGVHRIRMINSKTGIITTVAGRTPSGSPATAAGAFNGDGGLATQAQLSLPEGVAFDSFGNMFIADTGNNRIRMVDTNGIITTVAGRDLTNKEKGLDENGAAIVVSTCTTAACQTNSAAGKANFYASASAPFPSSCANSPGGANVTKVGAALPVTAAGGNTVCAVVGDGRDPLAALLAAPSGIVIDSNNNIFFNDRSNNRIRELVANPVTPGGGKSNGYGAIVTAVGTGASGNAGEGGIGTAATVNGVTALAVDSSGRLVFTERGNNRVRSFDPVSGLVGSVAGSVTFNGDGPCASRILNNPTGVGVDAAGNVYFADTSNNIIRKIDTACNVTTIAGILPRSSTGANAGNASDEGIDALAATLNQPTGIAVDPSGTTLYFADIGSNRIRKISNGTITTVAGCVFTRVGNANPAQNCLLTADGLPATLVKLTLSGAVTQNSKRFAGVALGSKGEIYFTEPGAQVARKLNLDGTLTTIAGIGVAGNGGQGGPAVNMYLSNPTGIAVDKDGVVFISDTANFVVHIIGKNGIALPLAGQPGLAATDAETANPGLPAWGRRYRAVSGLAVDNKGNVFIADQSSNKISRIPYAAPAACFATSGCPANSTPFQDYRVAGNAANNALEFLFDYSAPATPTAVASTVQLSYPSGIAVDSAGNVFFADTANNLIREAIAPK